MFPNVPLPRRAFLQQAALGVGGLAFASLSQAKALPMHHPAKAKRVIWLYMDGGISHLDTFDPKPKLTELHGKKFPVKMEATQFDSNGPCLGSPWKFAQHGQSGLPISELFPHLAKHADSLCMLHSMTNENAIHANANYWMNTGWGTQGRPSVGAWVNYALGTETQNLPGFIVLNGGLLPIGGTDNYKTGFLPAKHSPSFFARTDPAVANITPPDAARQPKTLSLIDAMDRDFSAANAKPDVLEAAIKSYELAAKLQTAVPELLDLAKETKATQSRYGMDHKYEHTRTYAKQCLLARRMAERGVRFTVVTMPRVDADNRWDAHGNLKKNHTEHALTVDQPIAALLNDLKERGLLEDTLVVFTTEFGRTPFTQGSDGRDHNQYGFTSWLAGGGIRGGYRYGATDELGYKAIEKKLLVHDFHATILYQLGIDHEKLTYKFGGRDYRLTDVHGKPIAEIRV
jgi:hypothetical protein